MIRRVVKLTFGPEYRSEFLKIFKSHRIKMLEDQICLELEAHEDLKTPGLFFTFSTWISVEALESYRKSAYFAEVWSKVKPLFIDKPEAWSLSNHGISSLSSI